jgi:radical SAM protein with 4Fe4S-binding SPASM domain
MTKSVAIRDVRFQVTHACNHKCPHCFSSSGKKLANELTLEEAKEMADQLNDCGMKLFTFTGGEPLLRKDFVLDMVEHLSGLGVYTRLFTNGFLVTEELAVELKKRGLDELQVSLDGLGTTHDDFRNIPESFDHAIMALKYAKAAGLNSFVRITVIPQNVDELPALIELIEGMGITGVRVRPFVSVGRGKNNLMYRLTPEHFEKAFGYLSEKRRQTEFNIQLLSPSFAFLYDKAIDIDNLKPEFRGKGCTCGTELCAITSDGWLKGCGYFSDTLGNIRDKPIAEMWSEHDFVCALRGIDKFNEFCMQCKYLMLCGGGCRASAYENLDGLEAPDPLCPRYVTALEEGVIDEQGHFVESSSS